jgi:hypothetical protein
MLGPLMRANFRSPSQDDTDAVHTIAPPSVIALAASLRSAAIATARPPAALSSLSTRDRSA